GGRVGDRQIGEHLAVHRDVRLLETGDEGRVAHAVRADGGVDADDPQPAEIALLLAAVVVGELQAAHDGLDCGLGQLATAAEIAFRRLQYLLAPRPSRAPRFGTGHGGDSPLKRLGSDATLVHAEQPAGTRLVGRVDVGALAHVALPLAALEAQDVAGIRALVLDLAGRGQLETLLRGPVRLHLRHAFLLSPLRACSPAAGVLPPYNSGGNPSR